MLVIMRRAEQDGAIGSSFTVGDLAVSVLSVGVYSVKLRVRFQGGRECVSTVPFNGALRPAPEVMIRPVKIGGMYLSGRRVRIGIEAPKHMNIARDDMIKGRAAA